VVVELTSESRARQPTTRAWAIIRRAERAHRHTSDRHGCGERRLAGQRASRVECLRRAIARVQEQEVMADAYDLVHPNSGNGKAIVPR
jgi:hypothetical protein